MCLSNCGLWLCPLWIVSLYEFVFPIFGFYMLCYYVWVPFFCCWWCESLKVYKVLVFVWKFCFRFNLVGVLNLVLLKGFWVVIVIVYIGVSSNGITPPLTKSSLSLLKIVRNIKNPKKAIIFFIHMTYQLVLKKYIKEKTQKYCFLINNI